MNKFDKYEYINCKNSILELYNEKKHSFEINNNKIKHIVYKWRNNSMKFTKYIIFENEYDYKGNKIFRDYRRVEVPSKDKKEFITIEFIIWANNENIARLRESKHWLIDCTYHYPKEFKELLVIEYKDILTKEKIPGMFILLNKKNEYIYNISLESAHNIITQYGIYDLQLISICTDTELALMNACTKNFPNALRIGCFFHYKQDLIRNIKLFNFAF